MEEANKEEVNKVEELTKSIKEYIHLQYDLTVLKTTGKVSTVIGELIPVVLIFCIVLIILFFLSLGLGLYLSSKFNNTFTGFFILGGIYFIILLLFLAIRKRVVAKYFCNLMIRLMLKRD